MLLTGQGTTPTTTVWGVIQQSFSLTTLEGALNTANLAGALSNTQSNFTVLAPNNAAFLRLGAGLVVLLANSTSLRNVLLTHVLAGSVPSTRLQNGTLATINGQTLTVRIPLRGPAQFVAADGTVAAVVQADLRATNGVVHIIDTVLPFLPARATTTTTVAPQLNLVQTLQVCVFKIK